ncbi:response regulator [Acidisphaera sp. L21]|uniref:response regulator n=1 Tax=Acidisphaera sp. L21 TaxID=1641851 RepID=UPI00131E8C3A|nr:response regulator [Acidisphaera sp. L21]
MPNGSPAVASALVLIVEDEALIRMTAADALTAAGFEVIEAEHAAEALVHLGKHARDIAVLCTDVHMPGEMDGITLAHHACLHWSWIGLLVVSGKASPKVGELPALSRFLAKPYDVDVLVTHVGHLARA